MTIPQEILEQISLLERALQKAHEQNAQFYMNTAKDIKEARDKIERAEKANSLMFWGGFLAGMIATALVFLL